MELVFATSNQNKVRELRGMIAHTDLEIKSLADVGWTEEIPETADTIHGNALLKCKAVAQGLEIDCFAEDTGLEVDALDKRPGVYSARYAGNKKSATANIEKLLSELEGIDDRSARFRTTVAVAIDGAMYTFEGTVEGIIIRGVAGDQGFGYDPVFMPNGFDRTFAQMGDAEKAEISHRGIATRKLLAFLHDYLKRKNPG